MTESSGEISGESNPVDDSLLGRVRLMELLSALSDELGAQSLSADLMIVGGAAMVLVYDARAATRDIDGVFEPKDRVYDAARRVAAAEGLRDDWLNDAAKSFIPPEAPGSARTIAEFAHLSVSAPAPEYLLGMKIFAARAERDADDIRTLYRICGYSTAQEGIELVERLYPAESLAPKVRFLLEELYPPRPEPCSR